MHFPSKIKLIKDYRDDIRAITGEWISLREAYDHVNEAMTFHGIPSNQDIQDISVAQYRAIAVTLHRRSVTVANAMLERQRAEIQAAMTTLACACLRPATTLFVERGSVSEYNGGFCLEASDIGLVPGQNPPPNVAVTGLGLFSRCGTTDSSWEYASLDGSMLLSIFDD